MDNTGMVLIIECKCRKCGNEFKSKVSAESPPSTCPKCGAGDPLPCLHQEVSK